MATASHSPTPEELMAYLDGEAPADEAARVRAHMADCIECRRLADDLGRVTRETAQWQVGPAPATLRAPAAVIPPVVRRFAVWRSRAFQLAAAAAVFLAVALVPPLVKFRQSPASEAASFPTVPGDSSVRGVLDGRARDQGGAGAAIGGRPREAGQAGKMRTYVPAKTVAESMNQVVSAPVQHVIRTATLTIVAANFDAARPAIERLVAGASGFIEQMSADVAAGAARSLHGTLRVPADRLNDTVEALRKLGQVTQDAVGSDDVTDQVVDLDARLASGRATERRLADLLKNRTGKLSDVLEVEREMTRVRLEIEQLDAQRTNIGKRVTYATVTLTIVEERKAGLDAGPLSLASRLRVATADGLQTAVESIVGTVLFLLRIGPTLSVWLLVAAAAWLVRRRWASAA
jgi:Domain of unknown function (DUF4349)/Putative zinc-finger